MKIKYTGFTNNLLKFSSLKTVQQHIINYSDLQSGKDLSKIIEQAYGPKGQGVLFVDKIPQYSQLRKQTLPLFHKLAHLPPQILKKYQRPDIDYWLGWGHGLQKINGKYDIQKGSFMFAGRQDNPIPLSEDEKMNYTEEQLRMYNGNKNVWIDQLPQFETNLKKITKVMMKVGKLIGSQIDIFGEKNIKGYEKDKILKALNKSNNYFGRALHYFPYQKQSFEYDDLICGWHNDYEILTTLTSAMYLDQNGKPIDDLIQDGLIVKNRFVEKVRIAIPQDMVGVQLAQVTQIWTGGLLEATPHAVLKDPNLAGTKISRNTFVLFQGPHDLQIIQPPQQIDPAEFLDKKPYKVPPLRDRWSRGITYKNLLKNNIKYYS